MSTTSCTTRGCVAEHAETGDPCVIPVRAMDVIAPDADREPVVLVELHRSVLGHTWVVLDLDGRDARVSLEDFLDTAALLRGWRDELRAPEGTE